MYFERLLFLFQLTSGLVDFVVKENLPFSIIKSQSLRKLLELVSKRGIDMPNPRFFQKTLEEKFLIMMLKLKNILAEQKYVCTTCDVWSCRCQSYIGKTVHFLTSNFERKSFVLSFRQMKKRQTHKELSESMALVLKEFDLDKNKVTNILTDGCSAFTKGFRKFGSCDQLANHSETELGEITNEDDDDNLDDRYPFIQNEDGEFFVANEITLESPDPVAIVEVDEAEAEPQQEEIDDNNLINELMIHQIQNETEPQPNSTIELPEQRRCVSHQLNLLSLDFDKTLPTGAKTILVKAINKLQQLWVRTHRSSQAKTICKEVI